MLVLISAFLPQMRSTFRNASSLGLDVARVVLCEGSLARPEAVIVWSLDTVAVSGPIGRVSIPKRLIIFSQNAALQKAHTYRLPNFSLFRLARIAVSGKIDTRAGCLLGSLEASLRPLSRKRTLSSVLWVFQAKCRRDTEPHSFWPVTILPRKEVSC